MNTRLIPDQTDAHPHRWPSAGIATARAADTRSRLSHLLDQSVCAANRRRLMPSGHKHPCPRGSGLTRAAPSPRLTGRDQPQDAMRRTKAALVFLRSPSSRQQCKETCTWIMQSPIRQPRLSSAVLWS